ncbi:pyruvate dehydrogenase complex E1 component subunit beta [candidate division KSB1 bacterium]|nr:pyruvate dehydrogenase complex E1 component subunit beta [candidate division KSB1 bacterium]
MAEITFREALNQAMAEEMERDENIFLMGEEVGYYQGAYKVSQGLMERFGTKRVIDTPIAELGFAGVGIGAAMTGLRPIIEFMTFNFSILALDQIFNNAAKLRYMSGGQIKVPIVFRGPGGAAHMLGAQHSQCLDPWFCNVPGLIVMSPGTPRDGKGMLKAALRDDNPVIFIESEAMYGMKGEVPDTEYIIPIGTGEIKREGKDITLIGWNKMLHVCMEAASLLEKEGIDAEVIDPRTLKPLDEQMIITSIEKTNRCVVVEEGWPYAGVGAEIAFRINKMAFDYLDAPVERISGEDIPMPYAHNLEKEVIPGAGKVVNAAKRALYID